MIIYKEFVVLADKLSNMRAIYRDYDVLGDRLWRKFNCKDKKEQKWYYEQIGYKLGHDLYIPRHIMSIGDCCI